MRIGIDMQVVGRQRAGDETYIKNLVQLFLKIRPDHEYNLYYTHREAEPFLKSLQGNCHLRRLPFHSPFLRVPLAYRWQMMKEPVDVFHTAYVGYAAFGA